MGKTTSKKTAGKSKKVAEKKLVGLSQEALDMLEVLKTRSGKGQTEVFHDLLLGKQKFNPAVEKLLSEFEAENGLDRQTTIETLLTDLIRLRARLKREAEEPQSPV